MKWEFWEDYRACEIMHDQRYRVSKPDGIGWPFQEATPGFRRAWDALPNWLIG